MLIDIRNPVFRLKCQIGRNHIFHQGTRLHVCPKQYCDFRKRNPILHSLPDIFCQKCILFIAVLKVLKTHLLFPGFSGTDLFRKTFFIVCDQAHSCLHNRRLTPVIYFKIHNLCLRVYLLKSQHNFRLRTAEPIDGLVIISHYKEIIFRCGKHTHDLPLDQIDILKFVDQNITVLFLPCRKNILPLGKQLICVCQHIIKIYQAVSFEPLIIFPVNLPENLLPTAGRIKMFQRNLLIFHTADLR